MALRVSYNRNEKEEVMKQFDLINKIAERAAGLLECDKVTIKMDLNACIEGGCNLRLEELLDAPDGDFLHDIVGINHHLNHTTWELMDCFLPRYAL